MSFPLWALFLGVLLITMVLTATLLPRLFMTSAMVYMAVGYVIGPGALGVIMPDPTRHPDVLERVAEVALLISLFSVGLKMGGVPLLDRRWRLPLRLALTAMAITAAQRIRLGRHVSEPPRAHLRGSGHTLPPCQRDDDACGTGFQ